MVHVIWASYSEFPSCTSPDSGYTIRLEYLIHTGQTLSVNPTGVWILGMWGCTGAVWITDPTPSRTPLVMVPGPAPDLYRNITTGIWFPGTSRESKDVLCTCNLSHLFDPRKIIHVHVLGMYWCTGVDLAQVWQFSTHNVNHTPRLKYWNLQHTTVATFKHRLCELKKVYKFYTNLNVHEWCGSINTYSNYSVDSLNSDVF